MLVPDQFYTRVALREAHLPVSALTPERVITNNEGLVYGASVLHNLGEDPLVPVSRVLNALNGKRAAMERRFKSIPDQAPISEFYPLLKKSQKKSEKSPPVLDTLEFFVNSTKEHMPRPEEYAAAKHVEYLRLEALSELSDSSRIRDLVQTTLEHYFSNPSNKTVVKNDWAGASTRRVKHLFTRLAKAEGAAYSNLAFSVLANHLIDQVLDFEREPSSRAVSLLAERDDALEELVVTNRRLVMAEVKKTFSPRSPEERLTFYGLGDQGLITGVQRYEPRPKVRIATYVHFWIIQAINRYGYKDSAPIHIPYHIVPLLETVKKTLNNSGGLISDEELAEELDT
ncbi:MAG: hypothetical protein GOV15_04885, partial [Candidatus Diapherotrites archaeon]|nr:hypothetical protein [Candidatus Diapherotrites archaeon]